MPDCKYGDPHCPCQDGGACHYESYPGSPAVACVPTEYVRRALGRVHSMTSDEADVIEAAMELETLLTGSQFGAIPPTTMRAAEKALSDACAALAAEGEGKWRRPEGV